jgi:hypothetical protein
VLIPQLKEKNISLIDLYVADSEPDFEATELEGKLAGCVAVVVLVSKDSLRQPRLIFAMETALQPEYNIRPIVIHGITV